MSKHVKMMVLDGCPHCKRAFQFMEELKQEHPEYAGVDVEVIEENREEEKTKGYDYWYVPSYFVDDVLVHEGVPSKEKVDAVFRAALQE